MTSHIKQKNCAIKLDKLPVKLKRRRSLDTHKRKYSPKCSPSNLKPLQKLCQILKRMIVKHSYAEWIVFKKHIL